ncbi:hypothetical protein AK812_SmicGene36558 [Symbiodinium microadriaticum]|uniref:Uncharacterized protein n=1 Tax=Symbiodinium microadriaticum TaxID=2951 RepID=A0A1Q9CIL0_SYMMI|nr:hypothetical protein AK812_SmicGene36558 [Symbiodinium microadriaticum]
MVERGPGDDDSSSGKYIHAADEETDADEDPRGGSTSRPAMEGGDAEQADDAERLPANVTVTLRAMTPGECFHPHTVLYWGAKGDQRACRIDSSARAYSLQGAFVTLQSKTSAPEGVTDLQPCQSIKQTTLHIWNRMQIGSLSLLL